MPLNALGGEGILGMENESTSIEVNLSILSRQDNNASSVTPEKEPTKDSPLVYTSTKIIILKIKY